VNASAGGVYDVFDAGAAGQADVELAELLRASARAADNDPVCRRQARILTGISNSFDPAAGGQLGAYEATGMSYHQLRRGDHLLCIPRDAKT
jgi:hypothetical protein